MVLHSVLQGRQRGQGGLNAVCRTNSSGNASAHVAESKRRNEIKKKRNKREVKKEKEGTERTVTETKETEKDPVPRRAHRSLSWP